MSVYKKWFLLLFNFKNTFESQVKMGYKILNL